MAHSYINIKNASLSYPSSPYKTLTLKEEVFNLLRIKSTKKLIYDVLALKNINLLVEQGERVGVIGRNGAGKSTLLSTIAGIYPLETGSLETRGSIRSLFSLRTGFEFEATGRENIMYRGLLQGETPKTIKEKEAEIIDFAELGDFIDFPIKTYSAGMIVRLAFAISTTTGGEILLLDEVFSAGDAAFRVKAKKRVEFLMSKAEILLFTSHDMTSIEEMCNRVIFMQNGEIVMDGNPKDVITAYLSSFRKIKGSGQ